MNTAVDLIAGALDLHVLRRVSFYDALIVQADAVGGCPKQEYTQKLLAAIPRGYRAAA